MKNEFCNQLSGNIALKHYKKAQKTANVNLKIVTFQSKFFTCGFEELLKIPKFILFRNLFFFVFGTYLIFSIFPTNKMPYKQLTENELALMKSIPF